jgi:catechol 2,3-dioxygenase-like lactoylglutathione lyase family enzyme
MRPRAAAVSIASPAAAAGATAHPRLRRRLRQRPGPSSGAGGPSGGQSLTGGRRPEPGGWNRIHLIVDDLAAEVDRLRKAGAVFRGDIVTGVGGDQILLEDPAGNPVELVQSRRR